MRIYAEKGFTPTREEWRALAAAVLPFGLSARIGREKTKSGYRWYVELGQPAHREADTGEARL